MSNFESDLSELLQETKERLLLRLARRTISDRISYSEVIVLARRNSASETMRLLRRNHVIAYLWKRIW